MRKKFKKGIETIINSETAKKAGKLFADYSSGLKDTIANQSKKLAKKYVKDNVTKDNLTGAKIGAVSESLIKQAATSISHGISSLQSYLKDMTTESRRYNELPEFEAAKSLFMRYAREDSMQGEETIKYKEDEFTINKTEEGLYLDLQSKQKSVHISSILKDKKPSQLEFELENITEDLLERVNWLADPAIVDVKMHKTLHFKADIDNIITYSADYKKCKGEGEITYRPNNQTGVKLIYTIFASKKMEDN